MRAYALDYYVPEYVPSDTDLLCAFRIEPLQGVDMIEASAAVAAESSTGTWTEVWSNQLTDIDYYGSSRGSKCQQGRHRSDRLRQNTR